MSHTVIGLFKNRSNAEQAVSVLKNKGFDSSSIDISTSNNDLADSALRSGDNYSGSNDLNTVPKNSSSEDGIGKFFSNLFGGEEKNDADTYTNAARRSDAIVTVHANNDEEAKNAADIMDVAGALDAYEEEGHIRSSEGHINATDARNHSTEGVLGETAKVIREDLEVGKKEIESGGIRLKSRIVERPVEESIRLRSEHVTVNRTPVNRDANEADFKNFKEGEVELVGTTEVPLVAKTAKVVEEVSLGKEASERTETVKDTLRNTEVEVEKIPGKDTPGNTF